MTINQIAELIKTKDYDFLRKEPLKDHIVLLGLGGSYAYGTNNENSDVDIRGIATNSARNILTGYDYEQVTHPATDTTVYSFDKMIKLLCSCNPNTIELLGLKPEHYLVLTPTGREIIANQKLFLSKVAIYSFGGYANAQLRRLENKAARLVTQSEQEKNILKSLEHAMIACRNKHTPIAEDAIKLYIDEAVQPDYDTEIFMDLNLQHYPLRDYAGLWNEMNNIVKEYSKIGKRNEHAIAHDKLGKHMCHLVRLYLMCFDILEKEQIITYRENEHDLLMDIRNGKYLDENRQPIPEFYELVNELDKRLEYAKNNTSLPDRVDMDKVNDFVMSVNGAVVRNDR